MKSDTMRSFQRLCVFCGSKAGNQAAYSEAARVLGEVLVREGIGLVFGGGRIGLMRIIADTVLDGGGEAIGVIPRGLAKKEVAHERVTELHIVNSMHERKALMADLSDGFIALPGGLGTLEEIAEALTWGQLGIHRKPCGILNTCGFYDHLIAFFDTATAHEFLNPVQRALVTVGTEPEALLEAMRTYQPPEGTRWLKKTEI